MPAKISIGLYMVLYMGRYKCICIELPEVKNGKPVEVVGRDGEYVGLFTQLQPVDKQLIPRS